QRSPVRLRRSVFSFLLVCLNRPVPSWLSRSLTRLFAGIPALKICRHVELQADERCTRSRTGSRSDGGAVLINRNRRAVLARALQLDFIDDYKLFATLDVANKVPHVLVLTFDGNHHRDSRIETLPLRRHRLSGSCLCAGRIER